MSTTNRVIYEFDKNALEKVKAVLVNYKGKDLFDIRVYFRDPAGLKAKLHPTKKGISLSIELIGELKAAVLALERALTK